MEFYERLKVKEYIWKTYVLQVTPFTMFFHVFLHFYPSTAVYKTTVLLKIEKRQELKESTVKIPHHRPAILEALRNSALPEKTLKHILYFRQSHFMMVEEEYVFMYIFIIINFI